ncbi:hypothetical protein B9Z55_011274 [Caenorhabditis nigoni]|uniref:Sdz-33 F-box domain-containing protein n=1 Tax=Caenorhabditis nigoni TaxID=1611254 RepID=A0A2G5UJC4_9PELO|nr:hypothetical protein B9Z55_011274 [Caenorhabditis nigoni]
MVLSLRLPIKAVRMTINAHSMFVLDVARTSIAFHLAMRRNHKQLMSLNDLPVNVNLTKGTPRGVQELPMSNQGMTLGEWIHHLCSISDKDILYEAGFYVEIIKFDIQSLRKIFPKLRKVDINFSDNETSRTMKQENILNAQNVLKAFLPDVQSVHLHRFPVGDNVFIQNIGMTNLKKLKFSFSSKMNLDCLFLLNVERCTLDTDQISLRDLNRFFKLWMKGSNPKLKKLEISGDTGIIPDWNVLLKGLKAKEAEAEEDVYEESKKYIIKNCRGIRGEIEVSHYETQANVIFAVLN